jgi:RNA polymerase sigma-B factor
VRQRHYEEQRLFRAYERTRSPRERDAIVERFLPLARSLARRYRRGGEPLEDLEQVAYLALVRAVDAFDPTRAVAFSSFAVPTISGALKRHYRDNGWSIRVPRELQELAMRIEHVNEELGAAAGAAPTAGEIAEYLGVTVEEVLEARQVQSALRAESLDQPRFSADDGAGTLVDTLGVPDLELRRAFDRATLDALLATLEDRDQLMVRLYYEQELTQSEIGERLGYSQMHVSRLLRRALDQLVTAASGADAGPRDRRSAA